MYSYRVTVKMIEKERVFEWGCRIIIFTVKRKTEMVMVYCVPGTERWPGHIWINLCKLLP